MKATDNNVRRTILDFFPQAKLVRDHGNDNDVGYVIYTLLVDDYYIFGVEKIDKYANLEPLACSDEDTRFARFKYKSWLDRYIKDVINSADCYLATQGSLEDVDIKGCRFSSRLLNCLGHVYADHIKENRDSLRKI